MADKVVSFFEPVDILGLGTGWEVQENNITHSNQRAQGLDATGDEAASKVYDGKSAGTIVYELHEATEPLQALPPIGSVQGGYHIDGGQVVYNPVGWPRVTFNVHQHDDNAHADTLRQFTPSLALVPAFGCPRTLGGITVPSDAGIRSVTHGFGITHTDELDGAGDHLAGENRDGMETLAYDFTGPQGVITAPVGWDEMSIGDVDANTAAETGSYAWEIHAATAVPVEA